MATRIKVDWVEGPTSYFKPKTIVTLKERNGQPMLSRIVIDNVQAGDKVKFLPRHDCLEVDSVTQVEVGG
jgi:hypothetical protein